MSGEKDLSRAAVYLLREQVDTPANYGVVPGSGTPKTLNFVTDAHKGQRETKRSQTGKSNQLPGGIRAVGIMGQGAFTFEMAPGPQLDEILEMGLCNTWTSELNISSATISFQASDNSINGTGLFTNVVADTWIEIRNATTSSNNGRAYVVSATDDKVIVAYHTITDEAADATPVEVRGQHLRNGTKFISASLERHHTDDSTTPYQGYNGAVCTGIEVSMSFREIITVTASFNSQGPLARSATSIFAGVDTPSAPETIEDALSDASNNMKAFRTGASLDGNVKLFSFNHENNVAEIPRCQELRPSGQSFGTKGLNGNLNGYLVEGDSRQVTAFDFTPEAVHVEVVPDTGPVYVITVFRLKYTDLGDTPKEATEGPVNLDLPWEAEESPTVSDTWIQVCTFPTA